MEDSVNSYKIVGRRKMPDRSPSEANVLLHTVLKLRGKRGICRRGVYKFKSYEEANEWMLQQLVESTLATLR